MPDVWRIPYHTLPLPSYVTYYPASLSWRRVASRHSEISTKENIITFLMLILYLACVLRENRWKFFLRFCPGVLTTLLYLYWVNVPCMCNTYAWKKKKRVVDLLGVKNENLSCVLNPNVRYPERVDSPIQVERLLRLSQRQTLSQCSFINLNDSDSGLLKILDLILNGQSNLVASLKSGKPERRDVK